ncbi:hypothetical protein [Sulfurimonas sp.]
MFNLFKKEENIEKDIVVVHNRLIDIRIGRKYARGDDMNGNTYECFDKTAEEVYNYSIKSSDDLKNVNKECFIQGYNEQTKELSLIIKKNIKNKLFNRIRILPSS